MTEALQAPFFIRGETRYGTDVQFTSRDREAGFTTPAINFEELIWPRHKQMPLHNTSIAEIIDFLIACGKAMEYEKNTHLQKALSMSASINLVGAGVTERAYRNIGSFFNRSHLEWVVEQGLGSRFLDGWSPVDRPDGTSDLVRAFPSLAVHVLAGNGPGGANSIVQCALTKGVNLLKVASSDLFSMHALLATMAEVGPNHPVVQSICSVYWRGGDAAVESRLFNPQNFDKIVAWGGESSMQHIRKYLGPGFELVAFDPKTSISMIGREAFVDETTMRKVANLAATDVNLYNQDACVSSRYQYCEATTEQADRYAEMLLEELAKERFFGPAKGPGPGRELKDAIDGLRFLEPEVRVFGDHSGRGTVIRSPEPVEFYPDRKTVNIVPVDHIKDSVVFANVATQTVGVYPSERKPEVRDELMIRGVQRVVPLGYAIAGPHTPHDAMYPLHRLVRWVVDETVPAQEPSYLTPIEPEAVPA